MNKDGKNDLAGITIFLRADRRSLKRVIRAIKRLSKLDGEILSQAVEAPLNITDAFGQFIRIDVHSIVTSRTCIGRIFFRFSDQYFVFRRAMRARKIN